MASDFEERTDNSVSAPVTYASWGKRVVALIIDTLVIGIPALGLVFLAFIPALSGGDNGVGATLFTLFLIIIAFSIVAILYAPLLMKRDSHNGQTLGKQWLGIRVVREGGVSFDFSSALVREFVVKSLLFGTVGGMIGGVPIIVDLLWPLWDNENQCLHDKLVRTHVIEA